jgi:predicted permease
MLDDLRYAVRSFLRTPGFTAAAVLSLAIGIGANTSIFSVVNALLLRPLPYKDADRLAILWNRSPGLNITQDWFSTAQYFDIRNSQKSFDEVAIAIGRTANLTGGNGEPERVGTILMSSNLLPMLGAHPLHGRLFTAEDDSPGRAPIAILMHSAWEHRFGRDANVIGKSITLNGTPHVIAGVLPPSFTLPHENLPTLYGGEFGEILLPLPLAAAAANIRSREDYNIVGKLKRGVSVRQAQADMDLLTARLRRDHPEVYPPNGGLTFGVVPMLDQVVGEVRRTLVTLLAAVGFVLLIACANVANLLLARSLARQKEIALRTALGASRARVLQQLLTESVVLAVAGGALGIALSAASLKWIHVLGAASIPRLNDIAIDARVLLFTTLLSVCSGIVFGLAPALRISRVDLHESLKDATRGSAGAGAVWGRGRNGRALLVAAELALSVILLIGAGLLIRSFASLVHVSTGFNSKNVLTLNLTMAGAKYNDARVVRDTYRQLWDRLERLPGVTAAGGVSVIPLGSVWSWGPIVVEGRTPPPGENFIQADQRVVGGHYFQAMEIPLLKGRWFDDHDTADSPRVIIVDQYMAEQIWPGQDPIGKRVRSGGVDAAQSTQASGNVQWLTVVGVAGRIKQYSLDADSRIAFYFPQARSTQRSLNVVVRANSDPAALTAAVKNEIRSLDPDLPLYDVRTMEQRVESSLAPRRFSMTLLGVFAMAALALATVGIYGVMAYLVSQGSREIGIRIALGATRRGILGLVVGRGMALASTGVTAGLVGAFALTRLLSGFLYGVRATDPLTFIAIAFLLMGIALLASYLPARRAAQIDPMESLRAE